MTTKLVDLDPRWWGENEERRDGFTMRCPCGGDHRCGASFGPGGWTRTSDDFATMTVRPSLLVKPCGVHVYVTDGEVVPC